MVGLPLQSTSLGRSRREALCVQAHPQGFPHRPGIRQPGDERPCESKPRSLPEKGENFELEKKSVFREKMQLIPG